MVSPGNVKRGLEFVATQQQLARDLCFLGTIRNRAEVMGKTCRSLGCSFCLAHLWNDPTHPGL